MSVNINQFNLVVVYYIYIAFDSMFRKFKSSYQ